MKGYATIASWHDPDEGGTVWRLLYPITRQAWFFAAMGGPEIDTDDGCFEDRNIAVDLRLTQFPEAAGDVHIQYNLLNEEVQMWRPVEGPISKFGRKVVASMWMDLLNQHTDSHSLRSVLKMPRTIELDTFLEAQMKVLGWAKEAPPVIELDTEAFTLLGVRPPWFWPFDEFVAWYESTR